MQEGLKSLGYDIGDSETPIIPVLIGVLLAGASAGGQRDGRAVAQVAGALCLMASFFPTPLVFRMPMQILGVAFIVAGGPALYLLGQIVFLFRATGGRRGLAPVRAVLLLTTTGRKSGLSRSNPLMYVERDGSFWVMGDRKRVVSGKWVG